MLFCEVIFFLVGRNFIDFMSRFEDREIEKVMELEKTVRRVSGGHSLCRNNLEE